MLEILRQKIIPDLEVERQDYLSSLSRRDLKNLVSAVDWLSEQVGESTAIWAVGSSVKESRRWGEVREANDLDLRLFTKEPNLVVDERINQALNECPPLGFIVSIEPSHRDYSTAHNSRLWPESGGRPVNIISTAKGDPRPAEEKRWKKEALIYRGGPFCELVKAT